MGYRKNKAEVNLLDLIPARTVEFELGESRIVTVLAPRFRNRFFRRWIEPRLKIPYVKVKLDEVGSEVWLLCDGTRNVGEIAEILRTTFREKVEPCYDRLGVFFRQLEQARFIRFVNLAECRSRQGSVHP